MKNNVIDFTISIPISIKDIAVGLSHNNTRETVFELIKELEAAQQDAEFLESVYLHFKAEWEKEVMMEAEWEEKQKKNI